MADANCRNPSVCLVLTPPTIEIVGFPGLRLATSKLSCFVNTKKQPPGWTTAHESMTTVNFYTRARVNGIYRTIFIVVGSHKHATMIWDLNRKNKMVRQSLRLCLQFNLLTIWRCVGIVRVKGGLYHNGYLSKANQRHLWHHRP